MYIYIIVACIYLNNENPYFIPGCSLRPRIKASFIWSKVKHLASYPSSLNKSLNVSSLSYNICDSDKIDSITLMAILHVLILLCSSDGQIKKGKRDLKCKCEVKVRSIVCFW